MNPLASAVRALLCASLLSACASATVLPDEERTKLSRDYEGGTYHLRTSLTVTPFFSDNTRRLVSPLPADAIHLLNDTEGQPILPGPQEGILPLGTRVRVEKVEFPTGLVVTKRPLYSPRDVPWLYLSVVGEPRGRPYVAVLRPQIKTREEFVAAVDALLTKDDPAVWLAKYPPEVQQAIREKRLVAGMDPAAVELAWGRPERIKQEYVQGTKVEQWTWPLGKRSATLREDRLVEATPPLAGNE
ncbi:MAG: hypothetical protein ACK4N5_19855 [Myxococcales bacterium]